MKNRSVTQHAFSLVPTVQKPRSVFSRPHNYKTTFDSDYLIPFYISPDPVLPGDTIKLRHSLLVRLLSPAIKPFMDNLHLDWFYFFCPWRLVWSNFKKFMGEQDNPGDSISYTIPQCTAPNVAAGGIAVGSLHDYLGLPVGPLSGGGGTTGITFNNLIPRIYQLTWNQWFRDENLQNSVTVDLGDGPDTYSNYALRKRGKKHDYFTSALPFLQRGNPVTLPLGSVAVVKTDPVDLFTGAQAGARWLQADGGAMTVNRLVRTGGSNLIESTTADSTGTEAIYPSNLYADLTSATSSSINTLRQAITLQQFLENDARGGTRYVEIVKHRWGVTSPDARQQRVEILALGSSPIRINSVAQTSEQLVSTPQANLAAFGVASSVGNGFTHSFTEHGTVIGLCMVRADLNYQYGLDRHWSYRTRYDLFNPEFQNLGEQAILNKEIYANIPDGTGASQKDGVFGYQERYAECRYSRSLITGLLRSGVAGSLDVWTLAEENTSLPTLGSTWIQSAVPLDRCIAVPSEPHFILDAYFDEKWARVMSMYSVPGLNKL